MAIIFGGQPGRVVALQDPAVPAVARSLSVDGTAFGFSQFKSVITRVMMARQGNFQFLHTLGNGIYLYVFGDRVGQVRLSGVAFDNACGDGSGIGIEKVLKYYDQNRIAARETPISVTIGASTTLTAYLGGIAADSGNPEMRMYNFDMTLILIPEDSP